MSQQVAPGTPAPPQKRAAYTPAHLHSVLHSPPLYTAMSIAFFLLFFVQPHAWRVAVWSRVRPIIPDERLFLLVAAVAVHTFVFVTANLCMALIYWLQLPFFEQFKIQKKPWPWQRSPGERAAYFALIRKSLALIAFNQYVVAPIMIWTSYDNQRKMGMSGDIATVPTWWVSMLHIAIAMVVEDTMFYWAHRTLHHPRIYGYVHKVHHSYRESIGLASEYAHPLEFIFSNAIPFTAGPLLTGMHYWTFFMWSLLRIGETVDGHSGYEFPWSPYRLLPFSGSSTGHEFHHSHNVGNFASFFTWWDRAMGTDAAFVKYEAQLVAEAERREAEKEAQTDKPAAAAETPAKQEERAPAEEPSTPEEDAPTTYEILIPAKSAASAPVKRSSAKKSKRAD